MINNSKTAILVVEFQKTWTERSFFHKLIKKEYESRNVYQNTLQLLKAARQNGLTIIQSPFILDKKDKEKYKKIYFIGFTTDHCVAQTMETLLSDGYECMLVSDCTAAQNNKIQQKIENKYKSIKSKQIIKELSLQ
jgi:nicotinamidase-related amidase